MVKPGTGQGMAVIQRMSMAKLSKNGHGGHVISIAPVSALHGFGFTRFRLYTVSALEEADFHHVGPPFLWLVLVIGPLWTAC